MIIENIKLNNICHKTNEIPDIGKKYIVIINAPYFPKGESIGECIHFVLYFKKDSEQKVPSILYFFNTSEMSLVERPLEETVGDPQRVCHGDIAYFKLPEKYAVFAKLEPVSLAPLFKEIFISNIDLLNDLYKEEQAYCKKDA